METNNIIDSIINEYNIIINIITIEELDSNKKSNNYLKSSKARKAINSIENNKSNITFSIEKVIDERLKSNYGCNVNDDIIVTCALNNNALLLTNDMNLKVKAHVIGVECLELNHDDGIYKGYEKYILDSEQYNDFWNNRFSYFRNYYINEYIIIEKEDGKSDEYRFDGNDLVRLKLPSSKIIKAENSLQRCALDFLNNNEIDICAVLGEYGSGKTFLSLRMALHSICDTGKQSKILGVREPVGEGKEVGYLKGDFDDKTYKFFLPLVHSLDGGEYELQSMIDRGQFESSIPYFLKGTTYNSTIIVCDEAEDLSERQIKLVGTRLGEGSRIFFSGDYQQSVFNSTNSNPLIKLCNELKGNPKFACIYLDTDVRSEGSKIFANLYKS